LSIHQAVILCGGEGTRLNDKVRFAPAIETPKPLMEVSGKPFVSYAINYMKGVGIDDIILMLLYKPEYYEFLADSIVRLAMSKTNCNEAVLEVQDLDTRFLVLNGDCFPIMDKADWYYLLDCTEPILPMKINARDAGVAVVTKEAVRKGDIDCSRLANIGPKYGTYTILGGLHIGTYQGLMRARNYFDNCCFGQ